MLAKKHGNALTEVMLERVLAFFSKIFLIKLLFAGLPVIADDQGLIHRYQLWGSEWTLWLRCTQRN